jgi:hypothetical protein
MLIRSKCAPFWVSQEADKDEAKEGQTEGALKEYLRITKGIQNYSEAWMDSI